ncbi:MULTISPECIES: ParB/RepB/Spo0J family partition protein [unclassified Variovorax]|uniref:ParB/RepB/Spo0J family partition protein n=1 Tax=unclassified Variovorax TaxID=663243 RepID=UPI00076D001B|nr:MULTISPECIES: ParB/RepB/Spo0J family partition protein [unclassified Variovorax]KWT98338.1 Chromosome (plasmid) partitioning protein ParB [Variovorax sp. WDL1]PNG50005.1 hypothetical protein CHC06_05586 [Variovorax sp. B2]PNG50877.1 hypothetical protein CHC07_05491 [Variovorax sp. B4]VTU41589.1 ParB/RepB/Spo0J family partition protein [Variovorax sp. PBL-H6]VTU44711.1 ParB/RepB/Spo0J family partition protein [Variovorax sp. SRS16]
MAKALPDLAKESFGLAAAAASTPRRKYSNGLAQLDQALRRGLGAVAAGSGGYAEFIEGVRYPVGARVAMPLSLVVEHPENPRVYFDAAEQAELEASLSAIGQQEAAKVFYDEKQQRFVLKAGHRRCRGLANLGHPTILVEVVEHKAGLQFFREARDMNAQAKGQHHLDDAVRFPEQMKAHRMDGKSFAKAMGLSESEVSKRVKIGTLPREILDELASTVGAFGVDACYWLAVIADRYEDKGLDLVRKLVPQIRARRVSNRRLQEIAKGSQAGDMPAEQSKRQSPERRCELKGAGNGVLKAFPNRLEFSLVDVEPSMRDQLFDRLEKLFKAEGLLGGAGSKPTAAGTRAPASQSTSRGPKASQGTRGGKAPQAPRRKASAK